MKKKKQLLIGAAVLVAVLLILLEGLIGAFWYFLLVLEGLLLIILVVPVILSGKQHPSEPSEPSPTSPEPRPSSEAPDQPPVAQTPPPTVHHTSTPQKSYIRIQKMVNSRVTSDEMAVWPAGPDKVISIDYNNTTFVVELRDGQAMILSKTPEGGNRYIQLEENVPFSISHRNTICLILTWIPA